MSARHIAAVWTLVLLAHVMCGRVVDANDYETNEENES